MARGPSRLPSDRQTFGNPGQGHIVSSAADRRVVLFGAFFVAPGSGVGVYEHRSLQQGIAGCLGAPLVAAPLQGELISQRGHLLRRRAASLENKKSPRLGEAMVRGPDGGGQHPVKRIPGNRLVSKVPGHAAPVERVINADIGLRYSEIAEPKFFRAGGLTGHIGLLSLVRSVFYRFRSLKPSLRVSPEKSGRSHQVRTGLFDCLTMTGAAFGRIGAQQRAET